MHAVVVNVTIHDGPTATTMLREEVVPRVKEAPGLVGAYWARSDEGKGGSMIVFDSEENARAAAEMVQQGPPANSDAVTIDSVEVREVVAHL
jgi:hypothetical protein